MTTATKARPRRPASKAAKPRQTDLEDAIVEAPPPAILPRGDGAPDVRMIEIELRCEVAPENVRAHREPLDVESLAANIATHGLIQPLVGYEDAGTIYITCGARRLAALRRLRRVEAPVIVRPKADAIAQSLSENTHRTAMHPADEARAWGRMVAEGEEPVAIANAFGVKERFVRQRLKLARLHQPILDALAADEISIDRAESYARAPDDRQAALWSRLGKTATDYAIKQALGADVVDGDDRLAKFVGESAYLAAGGMIERDLFARGYDDEEDEEQAGGEDDMWLDGPLVQRLAAEKLEAEAEKLRAEGWGFVEVVDGLSAYQLPRGWVRAQGKPAKSKAARAERGCLIGIESYSSKLRIERDVLSAKDAAKARQKAVKEAERRTESGEGDSAGELADVMTITASAHEMQTRMASAIVAQALMDDPGAMLTTLVAQLVRQRFFGEQRTDGWTFPHALMVETPRPPSYEAGSGEQLFDPERAPVLGRTWAERAESWRICLEPIAEHLETELHRWALPERLALLAFCLAEQVQVIEPRPPGANGSGDADTRAKKRVRLAAAGSIAGAQPSRWWTPDVVWFQGLDKASLQALALELGLQHRGATKKALAEAVAKAAVDQRWVPPLVRELTGCDVAADAPPAAAESAQDPADAGDDSCSTETVQVGDLVTWTPPAGRDDDARSGLEVVTVGSTTLTVRGHFGGYTVNGDEMTTKRKVAKAECAIERRAS